MIFKGQLIEAVREAESLRQVVSALGLSVNSRSYSTVRSRAKELGVELPKHKLDGLQKVVALKTQLVKGRYASRGHLKRKLLFAGLFEEQCSECSLGPSWNGHPLMLQLDHINGDNLDNRLENLRLLCPNCHSQTKTFAGKNRKTQRVCVDCGKPVHRFSLRCRSCHGRLLKGTGTKIQWPPAEDLRRMVQETSWSAVSRKLGVSVPAIKKHLKRS